MNASSDDAPPALQPQLHRVGVADRRDHHFLTAGDDCRYLGLYRPGSRHSPVNRLIRQFKCQPARAASDASLATHKRLAITAIASALRAAISPEVVQSSTWVPIPTSAIRADRQYDDRLSQTLVTAFEGYDVDVRLLLQLTHSTCADHGSLARISIGALQGLLRLDHAALAVRPVRSRIVLFDDLLTSGKHYRCCEQQLHRFLPSVPIIGCFIARRELRSRWWRNPDDLAAED